MKALLCSVLAICLLNPARAQEVGDPAAPTTVRFSGRIVAYDGTPISGAAITCADRHAVDTNRLLDAPTVTTGDDGHFELSATKPAAESLDSVHLHVAKKGMASVIRGLAWNNPEVGNIVLTAGQRLFGRVRDGDGKPLAGVRVTAKDLLEQGVMFRSGSQSGFHCAATTNDSGIFQLPCALPNGVGLEFRADGHESAWLEPVAMETPLEVTMRASGWIQGRVLDPDGRGIENASVTVNYELRSASRPVTTARDGSFRVSLDRLARWRITAQKRLDDRLAEGHSTVMVGPRENLEVIVVAPDPTEANSFAVKAVTKDGAVPVPAFRAVAVWEQYANQNKSYREYRLGQLLPSAAVAEGGAAEVAGPHKNGHGTGILRVVAEGFAPATVKDLEWSDLEDKAAGTEPLAVELVPEATVRGIVVDEGTGKPVVGARVRARPKPAPNEGQYPDNDKSDAVVTGGDGTFELKGLGEGAWNLHVEDDNHPSAPPTEVELGVAEARTDVKIELPSGAVVAGKLEGIDVGAGARVFLASIPKQVFGETGNRYYGSSLNQGVDQTGIPVEPDGSFSFGGVALGNHQLVVRLPSEPRLGGDLFLPIEPFRVRAAGIDRRFDCSEDRPGTIHGKIRFPHAQAAFENLVVVAQIVANDQGRVFFSPFNQRYPGPRSFVGRDGSFEIRVGPGNYQLAVVDLATSVALHNEQDSLAVGTGRSVERDLLVSLAEIELTRKPAPGVAEMAVIERVEVRFVPKAFEQNARAFGGNEQYDSRTGLAWPRDAEKLRLVLPEGSATFLGRNDVSRIRIDDQRNNNQPLGRGELEIAPDANATVACTIEVNGPPEIPEKDADEKAGDGDADADGTVREVAPAKAPRK